MIAWYKVYIIIWFRFYNIGDYVKKIDNFSNFEKSR